MKSVSRKSRQESNSPQDPQLDQWQYTQGKHPRHDLVTGINCVAFLLDSCCDLGGEPVDPYAAMGLAEVLRKLAGDAEGVARDSDQ